MNYQGMVVGPPGCGKTTLARSIVLEHLRGGGWALVHDPVRQYTDMCFPYAHAAAVRAELRRRAAERRDVPRGCSIGGAAGEVVALAVELGARHNRAGAVRVPILLVLDETSMLDTSGSSWMGAADNQLLSTRRHRGIGVLILMQRARQLPAQFWEMSTDVYLFRQPNPRRLVELDELLAVPPGTCAPAARLEPFRYVHVVTGQGLK